MLQQREVGEDERSVLESGLRRVGELEFLVAGLELVASGPSSDGAAAVRQALEAAAIRVGEEPDVVDVDEGLWEGIPHRYVERVAFELLSNATRYGVRPIEVTARKNQGVATLVISDLGGWSPPVPDFSAFYQSDMSATRPRGGMGLGLFMASRLCQAAGGDLVIRALNGRTVAQARFGSR